MIARLVAVALALGLMIPQVGRAQAKKPPRISPITYAALAASAAFGAYLWFRPRTPDFPPLSAQQQAADEIAYLARQQDLEKLATLTTDEAVESFLVEFWASRDPFPETAVNEARVQYTRRFVESNQRFSEGRRPGWRTDRGRVYLLYGPPEEIERPDVQTEIWLYGPTATVPEPDNLYSRTNPGRTKFVFTDPTEFGYWRQVYSTVPGEIGEPVSPDAETEALR